MFRRGKSEGELVSQLATLTVKIQFYCGIALSKFIFRYNFVIPCVSVCNVFDF